MALKINDITTILGVVLIVVAIGLALWGYQISGETGARFTQTITGELPEAVSLRYAASLANFLVGAFLLWKG